MTVATQELDQLVRREHANPHAILGAHPSDDGVVVRAVDVHSVIRHLLP